MERHRPGVLEQPGQRRLRVDPGGGGAARRRVLLLERAVPRDRRGEQPRLRTEPSRLRPETPLRTAWHPHRDLGPRPERPSLGWHRPPHPAPGHGEDRSARPPGRSLGRATPRLARVDRGVHPRPDRRHRRCAELRLPVVDQAAGPLPGARLQRPVHRRRSRGRRRDDDDHALGALAAAPGDVPQLLRGAPGPGTDGDQAGTAGAVDRHHSGPERRQRSTDDRDRGQAGGRQRRSGDDRLPRPQRQRPRRPGLSPYRRRTPLGARRRVAPHRPRASAPERHRHRTARPPLRVRSDERRHRRSPAHENLDRPGRRAHQPRRFDRVHRSGLRGPGGRPGHGDGRAARRCGRPRSGRLRHGAPFGRRSRLRRRLRPSDLAARRVGTAGGHGAPDGGRRDRAKRTVRLHVEPRPGRRRPAGGPRRGRHPGRDRDRGLQGERRRPLPRLGALPGRGRVGVPARRRARHGLAQPTE